MERRFRCTACGKCCHGWLPLTVADALAHAGRFPLAVVWTPIRQGGKGFAAAERLGVSVRTRDRKRLAIRIAPTAYIPPTMACPELGGDGLCRIHDDKPSRCRTMPFLPYRDEADQADLLIPRPGWACDVSAEAPAVYRDKAILDRTDFDREHAELVAQAPLLKAYAEALMGTVPTLMDALGKAAAKSGHVALGFAALLRRLDADKAAVARAQIGVLGRLADQVGDDYRRHYADWIWELERLA